MSTENTFSAEEIEKSLKEAQVAREAEMKALEAKMKAERAEELQALEAKNAEKIALEIEKMKSSMPKANYGINNEAIAKVNAETEAINKSLIDLAEKKTVGAIKIEKAAANSQLSSGAGAGLINTEMGPRIPSVNPGGYIRENAVRYAQKENVMTMPYVSSTISLTGGAELTAMAQSNPVLSYLTFTLVPYQCTVPYSKQLARNAGNNGYNIRDIILEEVQIADDAAIDTLYVTRLQALGSGYGMSISAVSAGILTTQTFAQAVTSTTVASLITSKILGNLAGLNPRFTEGASLQMHPATFWQLEGITDANNGRNLITYDVNGVPRWKNGMPIFQSTAFSAPTVALTASNACFIGVSNLADAVVLSDAGGIDVELFTAGSTPDINLITQYAEAYRVVHEFDLQLKKRASFFGNLN